jgi:hypothetical protein
MNSIRSSTGITRLKISTTSRRWTPRSMPPEKVGSVLVANACCATGLKVIALR